MDAKIRNAKMERQSWLHVSLNFLEDETKLTFVYFPVKRELILKAGTQKKVEILHLNIVWVFLLLNHKILEFMLVWHPQDTRIQSQLKSKLFTATK